MNLLVFILVYPFVWLISRLPMPILHIISDGFYLLNYYIIGYRKDVVLDNLKLAFPEKEEKELLKIRKQFFRHLVDFFIESIKTFTISEKEIRKRMQYKILELLQEVDQSGKSVALVGPHQANWEWLIGLPLQLDGIVCHAAYTRIKNPYFEKVVKESRSKFGGIMYRTTDTIRNIHRKFNNSQQSLYCLLSDQSPVIHKTHYWREFMGVKVPIHTGAEMLSKRYDMAYVVWTSRKLKRGYYEIEFELVTMDPNSYPDYELTDRFLEITERNIREHPETYLWSHKRFKHRDKVPEEWK
jgi:KDO2-lipid IV(A) lauroyltransferase